MFETTQPQVDETANQPDKRDVAVTDSDVLQSSESEPFLTVRYNKEDTPLSREDTVTCPKGHEL